MKYLGGKSRLAKPIAEVILGSTSARASYVEPFVGGGSVAAEMSGHFKRAYLSDASPDLILMWRALYAGWQPPEVVTEEEWRSLRSAEPSALRAFAGYGCSFGGRWFQGYARNNPGNDYACQSRNSLLRKVAASRASMVYQASYDRAMIPVGSVVYCDPPYANAKGYERTGAFDSSAFWAWAQRVSRFAHVFVSEFAAPEGWAPILTREVQASIGADKNARATEHLWAYAA